MTTPINTQSLIPASQLAGEDQQETILLRDMLETAEVYLGSHRWCPPIIAKYYGCGIGGIVAVFLFQLAMKIQKSDDFLWVIVGDVPSAYLVTDNAHDAKTALMLYCELMDDWVHAVLNGLPLSEVFPVTAPATHENANRLLSRIAFIRAQVIPNCSSS